MKTNSLTDFFLKLYYWITSMILGLFSVGGIFIIYQCTQQFEAKLILKQGNLIKRPDWISSIFKAQSVGEINTSVTFTADTIFQNVMLNLDQILFMPFGVIFFYYLTAIIQSVRNDQKIFTLENVIRIERIAYMGMAIILVPIVMDFYKAWYLAEFQKSISLPVKYHYFIFSDLFSEFSEALFYFVIAKIFRKGFELQQENDLTV